jgi:protein-S-isoprenylcysteine O-methyltransferase Ste14
MMSPIARLIVVVASAGFFFGLAVIGWGGPTEFFSHPPLAALGVVTLLMAATAYFAGGNLRSGVREDRGNRWVIWAFSVIGLLDGFLPAFADRHEFLTFDGDLVRWIGVALFAVGGALRVWPVYVLGVRFSGLVAIQPDHKLVTTGVYGVIRHPSYLGLLVTTLGWGLAFRSGVGMLLTALVVPVLVARIHAEERLLAQQFGPEYDSYRARTWRLLPWIY